MVVRSGKTISFKRPLIRYMPYISKKGNFDLTEEAQLAAPTSLVRGDWYRETQEKTQYLCFV